MTLYAHVTAGMIDAVGRPPQTLLYDGRWWDLRPLDPATLAIVGWLPVTPTPRPADTATTTHDYSVTLVGGVPTETWTERPKTQAEIDADAAEANRQTLTDTATLAARLTRLAAYKTDPDLTAVLTQQNNQALPTATLNRALKALVRENQRQSATVALLVRLIDPALLADVTDTTDA